MRAGLLDHEREERLALARSILENAGYRLLHEDDKGQDAEIAAHLGRHGWTVTPPAPKPEHPSWHQWGDPMAGEFAEFWVVRCEDCGQTRDATVQEVDDFLARTVM